MSTTSELIKKDQAQVKKFNELDAKIEEFKNNYASLTIADENDSEGYEKVRLALSEMRTTRTGLDKERKSVTEEHRLFITAVNNEYNSRIHAISNIEEPLKNKKKEVIVTGKQIGRAHV